MEVINIHGGSMYPALVTGDKALITRIKYKCGDIIVYRHNNYHITHRLICTHPIIMTKGDNVPFVDPFHITNEDIIGVVNHVYKEKSKKWHRLNYTYMRIKYLAYNWLELCLCTITNSLLSGLFNFKVKKFLSPVYFYLIARKFNKIYDNI